MFENWTFPGILPLGTILFNFLFFLIAIPIEAYIFHKRLNFDKKTSTFYAIAVNLFSGTLGWVIFFFLEPILPIPFKSELMNYVFFNIFKSVNTQGILVLTAFIIFFGTFLMKFFFLRLFVFSLNAEMGKKKEEEQPFQRLQWRLASRARLQNTNLVTTTLIANSLSYTAITVLLLIRNR
jgi:hypothetical protein